jgi:hypothetical protein
MEKRIAQIKEKLAQGISGLSQEDVEWLLKQVESLWKEVEFLKKELAYSEHQGEVGY